MFLISSPREKQDPYSESSDFSNYLKSNRQPTESSILHILSKICLELDLATVFRNEMKTCLEVKQYWGGGTVKS